MKIIYTLFFLLVASAVQAQQLPLFSQYREYGGVINPGSIPYDYFFNTQKLSFGASYRKQWVTAKDGPSTQLVRADYVSDKSRVAPVLGGYILNDKVGRLGMTGLYLRAAMLISDDPLEYGFSAGLNFGLVRYTLDLKNAHVQDVKALEVYDNRNTLFPDVGLGVYGYMTFNNDHKIYGGVSMPQALSLDTRFDNEGKPLSIRRVRHYYGTVGYKIPLSERGFLEGNLWIRYVTPLKPSLDFNVRWQIAADEGPSIYVGTGMSTNGNAHLETGCLIGEEKLLRIGVGADLPFTTYSSFYGNALELNVGYAIGQ